jgi:hypothetical protein
LGLREKKRLGGELGALLRGVILVVQADADDLLRLEPAEMLLPEASELRMTAGGHRPRLYPPDPSSIRSS